MIPLLALLCVLSLLCCIGSFKYGPALQVAVLLLDVVLLIQLYPR